jgi:cyclic pyranopterin phosphate synthase
MPDEEFADALSLLRDALDLDEVHLTGGEPTLHPRLPDIVRTAREIGYRVCMTSNGENGVRALPRCAGLNRVNFSIFGTSGAELAQVQGERFRDTSRAARKIESLRRSVEMALALRIPTSANIVVPNSSHALRVRHLLDDYAEELSVRLLNSLEDGRRSIDAIHSILADLDAVPTAHHLTAGASGYRTSYRTESGRVIHFKRIRPIRLPETCVTCRFNNDSDCPEGFYGVRLYRGRSGGYLVGVCIRRMDLCVPVRDFVKSRLLDEILELRETDYRRLVAAADTIG